MRDGVLVLKDKKTKAIGILCGAWGFIFLYCCIIDLGHGDLKEFLIDGSATPYSDEISLIVLASTMFISALTLYYDFPSINVLAKKN